ncbi:MAG: hypothetical protein ABJE66_28125 [Deltaproteobacteria bacterium]
MQPLVESILESRLADVLMGELFPREEIDDTFVDLILEDLELGDPPERDEYYAAYEIVRDAFATTEFVRVRDTRYDHIVTVEFPRELHGEDTAQTPKFSAPYDRIEIQHELEPEPGESARIPVERISVERMTVEPVSFARASQHRIEQPVVEHSEVAHGEISSTAVDANDEMQLELEDLDIEQDFFAKGDEAAFELVERTELDDESIDVQLDEESGARFMSYAQALPFPLYSAPFERVELGELLAVPREIPSEPTDVIVPRRSTSTLVVATVVVLACAIAAAVGLALLVVRSATTG